MKKQHIFIIGSKGIPAAYGGYETFVDKLTEYTKNKKIKYHVSCVVYDKKEYKNNKKEFTYNGAHCFNIKALNIGAAKAIFYDIDALKYCIKYIKQHEISNPIIYILACRIGPFIWYYKKQIEKLGGLLYVNPDGHEWLRAKWSAPVKKYWKISERLMVKHSDLLVCDNTYIEKYILENYSKYNPNTTFIAYGAEITKSKLKANDEKVTTWFKEKKLTINDYYLVVGRFVPENNFETMIKEFMRSKSKKSLALITNVSEDFLKELQEKTNFQDDPRIKFVGTVYDQELLKFIREHAYGYLHGHEVGGTNPSLLEALGATKLNLLLDVCFNKEVGNTAALYWNKEIGSLSDLIEQTDNLSAEKIEKLGKLAKKRIKKYYSWEYITEIYEDVFLNIKKYIK